jgi:predicted site-specific integrase-resolvase
MTWRPLGEREIAELLRVQANTVHQWRKRGLLPPPHGTVSGQPWWPDWVIEEWARQTRRWPMGVSASRTR